MKSIEEQEIKADKKKGKKKKDKAKVPVINGDLEKSKVAQMMFKTAIRNHLDLSGLADNKATTMLSVNTLIITIALPYMLTQLETFPELAIPAGILLTTCIISISFATLVTRPNKMHGFTSEETLKKGEGDLFFFGNFFNMNFEEYEHGMQYILEDSSNLKTAILQDLFYSGKALGNKYTQLRYCYSIFIIGLVTSAVIAVIVLAV